MSKNVKIRSEDLWNKNIKPDEYGSKEQYYSHIFEQYKIYVEAAEKVSSRRNTANTFFLSINSLIVTIFSIFYKENSQFSPKWEILFPLVAILSLCYVWWRLILSYKQLSHAKFEIINEYEKKLPSRPYVSAEWKALGQGNKPDLYKPLTDIENWIPRIFGCIYIIGAILIMLSK